MWPALPTSDYYGSSATPRRQQRTVRLPRTRRSGGHHRDASHVHHQPVGRVGAQLYPGDIAARYRNTPRGLAHPNRQRAGETVPSEQRDRASRQPIAASFGAAVQYRGFNHRFGFPTPFCLATAPGPLAADRCSIVGGCSRPPPHLRHQAAPQLLPAVAAAGGGPFHTHPVVWRLVAQARTGRRPGAQRTCEVTAPFQCERHFRGRRKQCAFAYIRRPPSYCAGRASGRPPEGDRRGLAGGVVGQGTAGDGE
jgi:hypothetical protein